MVPDKKDKVRGEKKAKNKTNQSVLNSQQPISGPQTGVQTYSPLTMNANSSHYAFYDNQALTPSSSSGMSTDTGGAAANSAGYSIQNILNFAAQQYAKSKSIELCNSGILIDWKKFAFLE